MTNRSELSLGMPLRFRPQHAAGGSIYDFGEAFTYPDGALIVVTNFWVDAAISTLAVVSNELATGGGTAKTNPLNPQFLTPFNKNFTLRLSVSADFVSAAANDTFRMGLMVNGTNGQEMGIQFQNDFFNGFRYGTFHDGGASVNLTPYTTDAGADHVLLATFNVEGTRYKIDCSLDSVPIVDTQSGLGYVGSVGDVVPFLGTPPGDGINPGSPILNMQYTADEP